MSVNPSPDGSPAGASMEGQQANAGEVLAMRMIQAAESAAGSCSFVYRFNWWTFFWQCAARMV